MYFLNNNYRINFICIVAIAHEKVVSTKCTLIKDSKISFLFV